MCYWPVWLTDFTSKADKMICDSLKIRRGLEASMKPLSSEVVKNCSFYNCRIVKKILVNGIFCVCGVIFGNQGKRNHEVKACKWKRENQKENKALCQGSRNFRMRFLHFLWHESAAYSRNKWFINLRLAPNAKKRWQFRNWKAIIKYGMEHHWVIEVINIPLAFCMTEKGSWNQANETNIT